MLKRLIRNLAARAGVSITRLPRGPIEPPAERYDQDGLITVHSDHFRQRPAFRAAYARGIQAGNGVDLEFEWRAHVALWAAKTALSAEGDFVECGVNAGVLSSAILHSLDWNETGRRFFLIDTFNGPVLSQFTQEEIGNNRLSLARKAIEEGSYVTDMVRIRANFAEWSTAIVVQGAVPDVLETVPFGTVAFLHLDMNCALPEEAAFKFFWDRLSPGAVVLLDDYCFTGYDCQRDAIDTAARARGADVLSLPTGQGLIVKRRPAV